MSQLQTFANLLQRSVDLYGSRDAFRIRTREHYRSITYTQFNEDVCNLAATLDYKVLSKKHIALIGENSYEWVVTYLAVVVSGGTIVPIDKELSLPEIQTILEQSEAQAFFCSDDYTDDISDKLRNHLSIEYFVINTEKNKDYSTLSQLVDEGSELRKENSKLGLNETSEDEIASIVFTSGTTGFSKGVMLSRKNLLTNVESADEFIKLGDCVLSVLPMHHTYEFTLDILFSFYQGRAVAINNSIKYFAQNIKLFAPSDMLIVPLVAENLLNNIWHNVRNQGKEKKLKTAIKISKFLKKFLGIDIRRTLFKDIHAALGGKLKQLFIGGAMLDKDVERGLRELGFKVFIGYGITECSPLVTGNITDKPKFEGSCGLTIPGVEIRLQNQNEEGDGEIEVYGDSIMVGYYKNPEATEAAFNNGWFRTGDIGRIKNRMLYITGRVKNLIVLKNGKNIYPEELEGLIGKIPEVKEVIVSSAESTAGEEVSITAEIFPDLENFASPESEIHEAIEKINDTLPYYKRIINVKFRKIEFPKTTTKKIKRY